jgi:hypothetical protein
MDARFIKDVLNAERVRVEVDTEESTIAITVRCQCGDRDVTVDAEPGFDVALLIGVLRARLCHTGRRLDS